jgi:hypothetical protein
MVARGGAKRNPWSPAIQITKPQRGDGTIRFRVRRPLRGFVLFRRASRGFARFARFTPGYHPSPLRGCNQISRTSVHTPIAHIRTYTSANITITRLIHAQSMCFLFSALQPL